MRKGGQLHAPVHLPAEQMLPASPGGSLDSLLIPMASLRAIEPGSAQAQGTPRSESSGSHMGPQQPLQKRIRT